MPPTLCFAILAHTNRPVLESVIHNVKQAAPGSDIVLFNSGAPHFDVSGLDLDVCPTSRPLGYGRTMPFLIETARWLVNTDRVPDFLVLIEPDLMVIKPGLAEHLGRIMGDAAYLGAHFHKIRPGWWDNPIGRRARWKWREGWRDLLGVPGPYHSFNPGQIFGREYIEKLVKHPRLDEILARSEVSRLTVLEEVIHPTLAISMGCRALANPGSHALTLRWYTPAEVAEFLEDPSVFLVHRVSTDPSAGDRQMIQDSLDGRLRPVESYDSSHVPSDLWRQTKILSERFVRRRRLDLMIGLRPEVPADFPRPRTPQ